MTSDPLELKAPGVVLTDDDRDQGISYARLLDTIAPLVVVTNGTDTRLYNTFTREAIDGGTVEEDVLKRLFENAATLAESEIDGAVRALLAHRPELWRAELRAMTDKALTEKTGPVDDLGYPLCEQFSVHRVLTASAVAGLIASGNQMILVTGDPMGGKTNVVALLCRNFTVPLPSETGEGEPILDACREFQDRLSAALAEMQGGQRPELET